MVCSHRAGGETPLPLVEPTTCSGQVAGKTGTPAPLPNSPPPVADKPAGRTLVPVAETPAKPTVPAPRPPASSDTGLPSDAACTTEADPTPGRTEPDAPTGLCPRENH
ncbi:hypothetical protein MPSD_28990 [Mycobacterium pseudoshottsii JCM 15466]|uniref:Uncharacterized protein n=1 Tax=Mycobacterium pseudoshottsii TaxID=265949 RepID=A0A9N7LS73_9MYCO|nr:hypothetical protein MPSD_28990 [Mycobacterium pseudoshottsii JCM 15466]BDN82623.1 hypothetical protein NJB1907Z4_C28380 [Mycobacterium pseudoshottsii]